MTKKNDMKKKTDAELGSELREAREKLRGERFAAAGSRPKDTNAPKKIKKTIARVLTEQRARTK